MVKCKECGKRFVKRGISLHMTRAHGSGAPPQEVSTNGELRKATLEKLREAENLRKRADVIEDRIRKALIEA